MIPEQIELACRFGYGPAGMAAADPAALLAGLTGPDRMARRYPAAGLEAARVAWIAYLDRPKRSGDRSAEKEAKRQLAAELQALRETALRAALTRIAETDTPFRERLAWFWIDHFSVRARFKAQAGLPVAFIEEAVRPHLAGRFADLLFAAETHPAMVVFLDQSESVGPDSRPALRTGQGLNENLAREILELHTLGVSAGYSQQDVRQLALLLTGLGYRPRNPAIFQPSHAQPGAETVLGRTYGGRSAALDDIRAVLHDLAARPETAQHLARKLAVHFVADTPPEPLVADLAAAYRSSGGFLPAVYEVLVGHPQARGPARKIRPPFEFIAAAVRGLAAESGALAALEPKLLRQTVMSPLHGMEQPFLDPPGPQGWPEPEAAWLTPQGVAGRVRWAMSAPARLLRALPDPAEFAERALGAGAHLPVLRAALKAQTRAEAIGIVLASPGFNRR